MEELGITITQLVSELLPAGFSVSEDYIKQRLKIWQLFMYENAGVLEEDQFDIEKYPVKWQIILGYLIMWDLLQKIILGSFIKVSGNVDGTTTKGEVKKITTGPTDVEFHSSSENLSAIIKALTGDGPLMQSFLSTACAFGSSLGIQLPFCPKTNTVIGPSILKTCNSPTVNRNCNECISRPKSVG